jgi:hypothetical protein
MNTGDKPLTVRVSSEEMAILEAYCEQSKRTKTDVIRTYLRSLKKKLSIDTLSKHAD